jgi:hypothetical protein
MNPLLITPAAGAASSVAHSALSSVAGLGSAVGIGSAPAAPSGSDFQQQLAALQSQNSAGPASLAGLNPAQLRQKLAAMSPEQQVALAQQLVGSTVSVADYSGHVHTGVADKLQIQNGNPIFQVGGHSYSLASLVGVGASSRNAA